MEEIRDCNMWVYRINDIRSDIENLIGRGVAIKLDEEHLLSKQKIIQSGRKKISLECDLLEYIDGYDGGEFVEFHEIQIGIEEAIDLLKSEIGVFNESSKNYAEVIYSSENPSITIFELLDEMMAKIIDQQFLKIKKELEEEHSELINAASKHKINWK